ncbi:MAG: hypothetical protein M3P06_14190 [Acidobacteriota bacterium]|nr:hypothetical protein [Acidobacteriota bacterium]
MNWRSLLSTILVTLTAVSASASTIKLSFALDPAETLPGIPVTFRVEALNTGPAPARVPRFFVLQVTPPNGEPFLASGHRSNSEAYVVREEHRDGSSIIVPTAGLQRLDWWASSTSPWYQSRFWIEPGQYRLRLIADESLPNVALGERILDLSAPGLTDPVVSNEVTLTIQNPTGVDAEVWKLIRDTGHYHWLSALANQVWDLYPDSEYTAYMVRKFGSDQEMIDSFGASLRKNPRGTFGDDYRMAMVAAHVARMLEFVDTDVQRAFVESEESRKLLEEILARDTSPGFKKGARERLEVDVMTMAELTDYHRRINGIRSPACERAQVASARNSLFATITGGSSDKARKAITDIVGHLEKYIGEASKTPPDMVAALGDLEQAVANLEAAVRNQLVSAEDGTRFLKALSAAAELSATKAIEAADKSAGAKRSDIELARRKCEEGRTASQGGDFKKAMARFREALHKAQGASSARGSFC